MPVQFPFAENEVIVRMIARDLGYALLAVPVMLLAGWRLYGHVKASYIVGGVRSALSLCTAFGWLFYFLVDWVIPRPITVDVPALQRNDASMAWLQEGEIGYFDCTLKLSPRSQMKWSTRKAATFVKEGERFLWLEGNADEPAAIAADLVEASKQLRQTVPATTMIEAKVKVHRDNREPMFVSQSYTMDAVVMIFREPNELVTPVLLLRY